MDPHLTSPEHPITPPPELVREWWAQETYDPFGVAVSNLATQAARWGADQQLNADREWLRTNIGTSFSSSVESELRAARRPKPPSLAEQALEEIQQMEGAMYSADLGCDFTATRAALERLQHLERESNDN